MEISREKDEKYMRLALEEAKLALERDEVPIGAIIVAGGRIVGRGHNLVETLTDVTAHAEIQAITAASSTIGGKYLNDCTLYVTVEPCPMCAAAISNARIARLYYGAADPKSGGVGQGPRIFAQPQCHHRPEIYDGIAAPEAEMLLRDFFAARRS
ncbi:MAG: nucleoside deaminase [Loktanella sp.]|nr:nucleoside deaminase [Loktanella sp.]